MGVLKVKVNGTWEEAFVPEPPMDEVWTGQESPDPSGTYELWYDTNTEPGVLKAKRPNGAWEIASPDEVWVSPDEPTNTAFELWVDTDEVRPPTMEEEVYVGPDDPDVIAPLNTVDMWYDPDDMTVGGVALKVEDLADVDAYGASKADGEVLTWEESTQLWKSYPPNLSGVWKSWSGTQAEYDALGTYDNNTLYAII